MIDSDVTQKKNPAQIWDRVFCCLASGERADASFLRPLQLRLAAQFATGVTAARAGTVVRLRDLAIVLGHVMSSFRKFVFVEEGRQFSERGPRCKVTRRSQREIVLPAAAEPVGGPNRIGCSVFAEHQAPRFFLSPLLEPDRRQSRPRIAVGGGRPIESASRLGPAEFDAAGSGPIVAGR